MRILVVDDDEHVRTALRRVLTGHGHEVTALATVGEAQAFFAADPSAVDAALLDVNIGACDGIALAAQLTAMRPTLRIAFVTGSEQSARRASEHGFVLRKPCSSSELRDLLASWTIIGGT